MHSDSQSETVAVTIIISYKPLSDLIFLGTQDTMAVTCPLPLWGLYISPWWQWFNYSFINNNDNVI